MPELRKFVEAGGTLLAIGSSTSIGYHLGLPIRNALVERGAAGDSPLPSEKFYVPGSILEARVDTSHPLAYGIRDRVNVFFDDSPAFRLLPEPPSRGVDPVAWFDGPTPLRSGWAWGQQYLDQAVQIVERRSARGAWCCSGRRSPGARSRTARSSSCSTGSTCRRAGGQAGRAGQEAGQHAPARPARPACPTVR